MNTRPLIITSILIVILAVILFIIWGVFIRYRGITGDVAMLAERVTVSSDSDTHTMSSSENMALSVGEYKTIDGLIITLTDIRSDDRCPIDAVCMQAGKIQVSATLATEEEFRSVGFSFPGTPLIFEGYRVSIKDVFPLRTSGNVPASGDYRIAFSVEKL
ncbi:MAG: hypothetical protein HGB03_00885 [Candidatus Yonathbacteria bacterium]|nr:hypothetical protein [Candidatus Yonathbacteria bacterium]NTW47818.1 hypothetical protein [Candidatus Yonathbacteria bacterium]